MNETVTVRVQKVRKNRIRIRLTLFLILAAALLLVAIFADKIVPYDPYAQDLSKSLLPPSAEHWMGTDRYGRDMFSRVVVGAQTSIFSTLALVGVISVFGTAVGTLCGYYGGAMDSVVMRISDVCLAFPGLVFALRSRQCWAAASATRYSRWRSSAGRNMRAWREVRRWRSKAAALWPRHGSPATAPCR